MMINISTLELIHLIATAMMVSIIWIIQILHYPTFLFVDKKHYTEFQIFHMKNISYLIIPIMLLELFTGLYILLYNNMINFYFSASFGLLILIWLITALFFSKFHSSAISGFLAFKECSGGGFGKKFKYLRYSF